MRRATIAVVPLLCAVLLGNASGCENQSDPATIPDGVTPISKNMQDIWNAPGGPGCRWSVQVKAGGRKVTIASGSGNHSQAVVIGTAAVGGELRSDKCGGWKR
jgi:hypothetical protein